MRSVQTPIIPTVGELIRQNPGTISLGQGIVNYPPPQQAIDKISTFLSDARNHTYGMVEGIPDLLSALEAKLANENRIEMGEDNKVVITAGGNMAFLNAVLAITDSGDEIIIPLPYFFNHEMAVRIADCKPICVPTDEKYQLRPDVIRAAITDRTRAIVTVSPNNPTGTVYSREALAEVNGLCREHGIYHISDEAYEHFTYDGAEHVSPGAFDDAVQHTISLFSFSKSYGFASWRIGYMVIPEHLCLSVRKIQDTVVICPPVVSQWAALGALEAGSAYCAANRAVLSETRRSVLDQLGTLADIAEIPPAQGAFYFLLRLKTHRNDMELVERLISEYRVAVIPGTTFGVHDGCYLRVAYGALDHNTVEEGIGRLITGLRKTV